MRGRDDSQARLAQVERGNLFLVSLDEEGQCIRFPAHPNQKPPATARAKVYQAREQYDWMWVTLGNPARDIPPFPQWDDPAFHQIHCGPYHFQASGPRAVENFLDVMHFPFVHQGLLGDPAYPEVNDYEVETTPDGITAKDISVWQPDPDGSGQGAGVTYTYQVVRPLTAYFPGVFAEFDNYGAIRQPT